MKSKAKSKKAMSIICSKKMPKRNPGCRTSQAAMTESFKIDLDPKLVECFQDFSPRRVN